MRGRDADLDDSGQGGLEAQEDTRALARPNRFANWYFGAADQRYRVSQHQQGDPGSHERRQRGNEAYPQGSHSG